MPSHPGLPPASGAWRPGTDAGNRRFHALFTGESLRLEAGGELTGITMAYETWGKLNAGRSNAVLVLHALTGDSHVAGAAGAGHPTAGWWEPLVGPGSAIDTDRWFVVCPNVLGGCQGTTGPSSPGPGRQAWGSRFPRITVRDQVEAEAALADSLEIETWAAIIGGSMGGMRVLEWAVSRPHRVASAIVIAVGAAATADQIGLGTTQIAAIRADPNFRGGDYYDAGPGHGPHVGMGIARRLGQMSYRSEIELALRFGCEAQTDEDPLRGGRYAVDSYLEHHAAKLARRFDANSYVVLTEAMNHHDIGRGRGGVAAALRDVTAPVTLIGITSDRLYPLRLQYELAELLPTAGEVEVVDSVRGHDGFLVESEAVGRVIAEALLPVKASRRSVTG